VSPSTLKAVAACSRGPPGLGPALTRAGITKPFRAFHDLRHTALTHEAAAGNPLVYVQMKAGHSQSQITERYIHASQVLFPGAAARGEARMFALTERTPQTSAVDNSPEGPDAGPNALCS